LESSTLLTLLHLSAAFDKCAKKRGVFKVETIGDSYVAVTGCPSPRKDRKWLEEYDTHGALMFTQYVLMVLRLLSFQTPLSWLGSLWIAAKR
jgi:class 3 adenylate cyclase